MAAEGQSIDFSSSLFHVTPSTMEKFCRMMDCCDGDLGWRGLAEQLSTDWMEFRKIEKYAEQGKSRTRELLWSWAQKNKTVGDLLQILQRMDHKRAIHLFTRQEIKLPFTISFHNIREATKDFHDDMMIGEGHFFKVYKAEIQNRAFAVKLLKQDKKEWQKSFILQLEVLLVFHHPNILELVSYFGENGKLCVVHPYMKNGSLLDRLQCMGNSHPLSWQIRLNILIGTARAIHYLHTRPSAVPCGNITSANILLDKLFQPKLSDYAMANLRSYTMRQSCTMKVNNDAIWFLGYLPEESIRQGTFSFKADIYSFGVVIMEALTGYKAVLEGPDHICWRENENVVQIILAQEWAKAVLQAKHSYPFDEKKDLLMELMAKSGVDSCLPLLDKKADTCPSSMSYNLLSLAFNCTSTRAKLRPTIDEVLETLESTSQVCFFSEDLPRSLRSCSPPLPPFYCVHSIPVENDENQDFAFSLPNRFNTDEKVPKHPCECSQSEVTFLGCSRTVKSQSTGYGIKVCAAGQEER
ncbi:interleukin-1 receptor-associated kinase 3 [Microcaecilia unicolor]|uniref:Interleukin-1 receptor-associated kinase 3 n=1 Tax=Microcaecilia unicolor TaxID=1415580 RepID=A0A6P7Z4A5_9AMPH|nr:interleukin-1 receptor-associated kinase 3 [Microcaecilia unicolor]